MFRRAAHRKTTEEQDEEADEGGHAQQRQESEPEEEIEKAVDNNTGDRFRRGGVDLRMRPHINLLIFINQ